MTTDAVQVFGGYGFTREYPVERYMRDANKETGHEQLFWDDVVNSLGDSFPIDADL